MIARRATLQRMRVGDDSHDASVTFYRHVREQQKREIAPWTGARERKSQANLDKRAVAAAEVAVLAGILRRLLVVQHARLEGRARSIHFVHRSFNEVIPIVAQAEFIRARRSSEQHAPALLEAVVRRLRIGRVAGRARLSVAAEFSTRNDADEGFKPSLCHQQQHQQRLQPCGTPQRRSTRNSCEVRARNISEQPSREVMCERERSRGFATEGRAGLTARWL